MILEDLNYNSFGYYSTDLSKESHKKIITSCDKCGLLRIINKRDYRDNCFKCSKYIRWNRDKIQIELELLLGLYYGLDMSTYKIANLFNCSQSAILSRLYKYKIPIKSQSERQKGLLVGSKNPNWKGGTTDLKTKIRESKDYYKWRESIYERDNYTCLVCNNKNSKLNVHHLYNFIDHPTLRLELENGITICEDCHKEFHNIYGKKYNTPNQFEMFVNNKLKNGI